jgi:hypothetical protein
MINRLALLFAAAFSFLLSYSQEVPSLLRLRTGSIVLKNNLRSINRDSLSRRVLHRNKGFVILQFETLPTTKERDQLAAKGIELLEYIPDNAYTATVKGSFPFEVLLAAKAKDVYQPTPQQKMDVSLASGLFPTYSVKVKGTVDVWISFPKTFSVEEVEASLKEEGAIILATPFIQYRIIHARIATQKLFQIADQPTVAFITPAPPPDQPLNNNSRSESECIECICR